VRRQACCKSTDRRRSRPGSKERPGCEASGPLFSLSLSRARARATDHAQSASMRWTLHE